jgi:outer membrane lipoprotein SlyB
MRRRIGVVAIHLIFGATCASAQSGWTPTVDTFGSSRAQYLSQDLWECRELATQTSGTRTGSAARGALRGGAVGAAGGAAIGAALGNAGRGAAIGAAAGGISRGAGQASGAEAQFRRAFSNCLRARGHNVID